MSPDIAWNAISRNLGALFTFFDAVILHERLPIFDYGASFEPAVMNLEGDLVEVVNQDDDVLVPVHVHGNAYVEMKTAAVAQLAKEPPVDPSLANDVREELEAYAYAWRPDLSALPPGRDPTVDTFLFGGLLFAGYAQRIGGEHVLQPKRARMYIAAALRETSAAYQLEEALFARLASVARQSQGMQTIDLPAAPTFLPYLLLTDPTSPIELLRRALAFRTSPSVQSYRRWRARISDELAKGRLPPDAEADVAAVGTAIAQELKARREPGPLVRLKGTVALVPSPNVEVGLEREVPLFAWSLRNLFRPHRKLLQRLVLAEQRYQRIDLHLEKLWNAA